MESNASKILRLLKRLKAAVGYHELGMTQHALRCLDSLASLGEIGHFAWLRTSCGTNSSTTPTIMSPPTRPWRSSPACCRRLGVQFG